MPPLRLVAFNGVAYRAISGVKPLWRKPNVPEGRFNHALGHADARPTQYLCLHPMGPMAEFVRHVPVAATNPSAIARNVFALKPALENVLEVSFDDAPAVGIAPEALVDDDYAACQAWIDGLLASDPRIEAIRVPSAALPGTDNLVVFGGASPISYDATPRKAQYLPCGVVSFDGHPHSQLLPRIRHLGMDHSALDAWKVGRPFRFAQPDPA